MKKLYDRYVLPHLLDYACSLGDVMRTRAAVVPRAEGRVLEIGIGTGLNLGFYQPERVTSITGVDPAAEMHQRARQRAEKIPIPVRTVALELGEIQADAGSFDSIVCTFTLCTIPDADAALREMRRVLKPGGHFLFGEHSRAPEAHVARWQDRLTPLWKPLSGGCHLNRDIPELIRAAGFEIGEMESGYIAGPKPMTFVHRGWAK